MFRTLITQSDEPHSPPSQKVLSVEVIGRQVFLDILEYDENHEQTMLKSVAQVVVPVMDPRNAVLASLDHDLAAKRPADASSAGES